MPKKKRKIKERITAGTMAVLLALTGSFAPASGEPKSGIPTGAFGSGPIPAYATEINTSAAAISTKAEQSQSAPSVSDKTQSDLTKAGKTQADLARADKTQADISGTETLQSNSTGAEDSRSSSTGIETIQSNPTGTADFRYAATRTETEQFDPTGAKEFQSGATGTETLQSEPTGTEASRSNQAGTEAFNAALGGIKKYFMKLETRAFQTVTPGESLADATTSVSFDAADGYYYLVRLRPEPDTDPEKPDTAVQALDNGWIRKIGSGTYVWQNLSWNRTYDVYELNLSASPTELRKLGSTSTNTGKVGGTLSIEGDLLTGSKIKAVIENPTTEAGDWSWYTADSTGAAVWTPCTEGAAGAELTIPVSAAGLYVKAVFTASTGGDFEGSLEIISSLPAASALTGTTIAGTAVIGEQLTASVLPEVCEPGVRYEWYRTSSSALESTGGQFLYTGNPYTIQAEDIGNCLYVKAVSLPDSVSAGESVSTLTEVMRSVPYDAPSAPEIKKTGATALTVAMPLGTDTAGLYEFGYSTQPTPDKTGSDFHTVTAKARGTGEVTIPELASSTVYYIWAKRSGEGGFTDSPWSTASASGATLPPALAGGLTMTGSCIYGETLEL